MELASIWSPDFALLGMRTVLTFGANLTGSHILSGGRFSGRLLQPFNEQLRPPRNTLFPTKQSQMCGENERYIFQIRRYIPYVLVRDANRNALSIVLLGRKPNAWCRVASSGETVASDNAPVCRVVNNSTGGLGMRHLFLLLLIALQVGEAQTKSSTSQVVFLNLRTHGFEPAVATAKPGKI